MAIIRRRLGNISDALQAQQNEEELLRRRAALQQQQESTLTNLIPSALQGVTNFADSMQKRADFEKDRRTKEEERLFELAKYADVGEYTSEDPVAKIAEQQVKKELEAQATTPIAVESPQPQPLPPLKSVADLIMDPEARAKRIAEQQAAKPPIQPSIDPATIQPKSIPEMLSGQKPNALGGGKEIVERVNYQAPAGEQPVKSVPSQTQPKSPVPGINVDKLMQPQPDVVDPAEKKIQADQEKRVVKDAPKNIEDLRRVSLVNQYKPLKWSTSPEEEAKKQVNELFKSRTKETNVFSQLFSFGAQTGRDEQVKAMAEKIALKNIRESRNKIENNHFDRWAKEQEQLISASKAEEDIVLKQAQAQKALQPTASYLRISGDKVKDLQAGTAAIRQAKLVKQSFDNLMKKGGDGFPPIAAKNKIIAKIYAAGANTDASSAGGGGGVGALGTGVNASVSQSGGGRYVDPKTFAESIDKMSDLEMSPAQRQFMKNSILLAQATGKQLEGGRMTDADLVFYLNNLYDWNSPESLNESFANRLADTFARYRESYGSYTADNPNLAGNFTSPDDLQRGFDFTWSPERFGYESASDWNAELDRQNKENYARMSRIESGIKGGPAEAGRFGYGKRNTIKGGVQEGLNIVKSQLDQNEPKPKSKSLPRPK